jgi:hypothetical protein
MSVTQQIDVAAAFMFREPSSDKWLEAAVNQHGEDVARLLISRMANTADTRTIGRTLTMLDEAVARMPLFTLSPNDYRKCEDAANKLPSASRNNLGAAILSRLKVHTAQ